MKQSLIVSLPIAILGTLLALIPGHLLPVCEIQHGAAPMRCHWSGMVMSGFGVAFFAVAALLFFIGDSGVRIGLSAAAVLMAALAAAVPAWLIGMCMSPAMPCRIGAYPALLVTSALIGLAGVSNILFLKYHEKREQRGYETSHNLAYRPEQS